MKIEAEERHIIRTLDIKYCTVVDVSSGLKSDRGPLCLFSARLAVTSNRAGGLPNMCS